MRKKVNEPLPSLSLEQFRTSAASLKEQNGAQLLDFADILQDLRCPINCEKLAIRDNSLYSNISNYPIQFGCPVLFPPAITPFFEDGQLRMEAKDATDAISKYFYLSVVKHWTDSNADSRSPAFEIHLTRLKRMLSALPLKKHSRILDVGCDDTVLGAALFEPSMSYVGLDTFCSAESSFRIVGCAEFLPFGDNSADIILFNTSLDHVQDFRTAIHQSLRILRPGGILILASLFWRYDAELYNDIIHFHHFRRDDIFSATKELSLIYEEYYAYKSDDNRYGGYLAFEKSK